MSDNKKAAAGARTPTTASSTNHEARTTFDYNTACNVWGVMCELLGRQEGVKLVPKVSKKNEVSAG